MNDEAPQRRIAKRLVVRAALLLTLAIICLAFWNRQPKYNGRTLDDWLLEMNSAASLEECAPSLEAIKSMGPSALPFLVRNIQRGAPPKWEERLSQLAESSDALAKIIPIRMMNLSPTCLAFHALGTNAAPIIPELERLFIDSEMHDWPGLALLAIGSNAAPAFVRGCASTREEMRARSGLFLAKVIDGREEWWDWAWAVSTKNGRRSLSLGFTINDADLQTLARHLEHENVSVRSASAEALKQYGRYHPGAMEALERAEKDADPAVRQAAKEALYMFEIRKRNGSAGETK